LFASPEYPRLLVIDKVNGGSKADALNAGINLCRAPLFCAVDADSLLEADALLRAVQPFVADPIRTVAVGGTIRTINGCQVRAGQVVKIDLPHRWLPLLQTIEYLRAFLMGRLAWGRVRTLTLISGAFGIFRRQIAVEIGGYSRTSLGEDLDIIMRIHRHMLRKGADYRIHFVPEPVCWTEVPEHLGTLARQRIRWQRGALETFFSCRDMLFRPRYGRIGTLGLGHMLIVDVLGPPAEMLGYVLLPTLWVLGLLNPEQVLAYLAVTFTFGVFLSIATLMLEEVELKRFGRPSHLLKLTGIAVLENFGYRQLNNFWRIVGWWRHALGVPHSWGEMTRAGFRKT
jgi:cellulose synthase/poly-beta-1,6-N-acetylglucosamine synthase-like glycosyltransferase